LGKRNKNNHVALIALTCNCGL